MMGKNGPGLKSQTEVGRPLEDYHNKKAGKYQKIKSNIQGKRLIPFYTSVYFFSIPLTD